MVPEHHTRLGVLVPSSNTTVEREVDLLDAEGVSVATDAASTSVPGRLAEITGR
ncbi:hypothetical protein [Halorubellus sp. PRR65]|uniref:hypothetical protein n=1 Tax=Halorubellus sp. PRR65 TaxID=3098148 RepID=UPI002B25DD71|nr:hypothetical protein [Halorubellus sp. PRR65]